MSQKKNNVHRSGTLSLSTYQSTCALVYKDIYRNVGGGTRSKKATRAIRATGRRRKVSLHRTPKMTSGTNLLVNVASAGSGIVVVACLLAVANLYQDINSLYDEVMVDLSDFRTLSNDAWMGMVAAQGRGTHCGYFRSVGQPMNPKVHGS
uniref:Col_cuticle_N domain-containing protein n=1 Tax=Steinernema glaseri TaxID=37863 RepID=A0A1I7ZMB6_9BILA